MGFIENAFVIDNHLETMAYELSLKNRAKGEREGDSRVVSRGERVRMYIYISYLFILLYSSSITPPHLETLFLSAIDWFFSEKS